MGILCAVLLIGSAAELEPGDTVRRLEVEGRQRSYLLHVPPGYDPDTPTPVVLAFHGAAMNATMMSALTRLNDKADEAGFLVVYPNGEGVAGLWQTFNSGGLPRWMQSRTPDDVLFVSRLLDDLESVANIDRNRVFATGISNGGIMCYRLAAELSDRIAAIAPVSGSLGIADPRPTRPVSVLHFHGTDDLAVPWAGVNSPDGTSIRSVDETIETWRRLTGCPEQPTVTELPDRVEDGTQVVRTAYGPGRQGAEVVLYRIEGGGHTWPGEHPKNTYIGATTREISANDLMWEFFRRHPRTAK